jgi:hypothetical protein
MKKILTILLIAFSFFSHSQAPNKMSYQAVIRDGANTLIVNQSIGMQISILQGNINGAITYQEIQMTSTNGNGLVSIEIGNGNTINGDFSTIDWANGPYFIKTETDPMGGANYTITGTTQLLSVPYALYAATAGNNIPGPQGAAGLNGINGQSAYQIWLGLGNTGTETDFINSLVGPQGSQGVAGAIGAQGPIGLTGPQGIPGPQGTAGIDGQGGVSVSGNGIIISGTGISSNPYVINAIDNDSTNEIELPSGGQEGQILKIINGVPTWTNENCHISIGQFYEGGIVFYIDSTGCHGLVVFNGYALSILGNFGWGCQGTLINGADGSAIGTGLQNTMDIEAGCSAPNTAADVISNLNAGGYNDWFLPSKDELFLMYQNVGPGNAFGLGTLVNFGYGNGGSGWWTSTEFNESNAYQLTGVTMAPFYKNYYSPYPTYGGMQVKAVRQF